MSISIKQLKHLRIAAFAFSSSPRYINLENKHLGGNDLATLKGINHYLHGILEPNDWCRYRRVLGPNQLGIEASPHFETIKKSP